MTLEVNGKNLEFQEGENLAHVLAEVGISATAGLAVAVNNKVVPKKNWDSHQLNAGDKILCINATQGG